MLVWHSAASRKQKLTTEARRHGEKASREFVSKKSQKLTAESTEEKEVTEKDGK